MTTFSGTIERELGGGLIVSLNADGAAFRQKGKRGATSIRVPWEDVARLALGGVKAPAEPVGTTGAIPATAREWHCPKCGFANDLGPGPWACPDCAKAGDATELVEGSPRIQGALPLEPAPAPAPAPAQAPLPMAGALQAPAPQGDRKRRSQCPTCKDYGYFVKGSPHVRDGGVQCKGR